MPRTTIAAVAMLLAVSAGARAAETQIVVHGTDPATVHEKVIAAAAKVCAAAVQHDPFGDFGSQEECIENTLRDAHPITTASR